MSFDLDQECRHAKERLRVSIEANTTYELVQMRKKYAKERLKKEIEISLLEKESIWYRSLLGNCEAIGAISDLYRGLTSAYSHMALQQNMGTQHNFAFAGQQNLGANPFGRAWP